MSAAIFVNFFRIFTPLTGIWLESTRYDSGGKLTLISYDGIHAFLSSHVLFPASVAVAAIDITDPI